MQKIFFKLCLILGVSGIASCSGSSAWWNNGEHEVLAPEGEYIVEENPALAQTNGTSDMFTENPAEAARIFNKRIPPLNSLLVCRDKQCAPAELSQSREYIYNALAHLIDNNLDETALLCEANPQAHVCVNPYITVPAKVGVTPAYVYFDGVKFVDASVVKGKTAINLVLGYNLSYNGQTPFVCKPDTAMLYVKNNNGIMLNGKGFPCEMTSIGTTTIRVMFAVDYVDLDYGYIGGYYSIGLSGPAYGGGSGYGMIRLTKDAHPLAPSLKAPATPQKKTYSQASVKPVSNLSAQTPAKPVENSVKPAGDNMQAGEQKPMVENQPAVSPANNSEVAQPENLMKQNENINSTVATPAQAPAAKSAPVVKEQTFEEIYVDDLDDYIK